MHPFAEVLIGFFLSSITQWTVYLGTFIGMTWWVYKSKWPKTLAISVVYGLASMAAVTLFYRSFVIPFLNDFALRPEYIQSTVRNWIDKPSLIIENAEINNGEENWKYSITFKKSDNKIPVEIISRKDSDEFLIFRTGIHLNDYDESLVHKLSGPEFWLFKNKLERELARYGFVGGISYGMDIPGAFRINIEKKVPSRSLTEEKCQNEVLYIRRGISIVNSTVLLDLEGWLYEHGKLSKPRGSEKEEENRPLRKGAPFKG